MPDEHEHPGPIEKIGNAIGDCLPESWRTHEVGYAMGCVVGFVAGWVLGETVVKWMFPNKGGKT
jgi:hypothetical protein